MFIVIDFQSFRGNPQGVNLSFVTGGVETLRQVEAKYPALLFKQQLTAYVEKIYGMIRDNLKKEISPLLGLCIQVSVENISRDMSRTCFLHYILLFTSFLVILYFSFVICMKTVFLDMLLGTTNFKSKLG